MFDIEVERKTYLKDPSKFEIRIKTEKVVVPEEEENDILAQNAVADIMLSLFLQKELKQNRVWKVVEDNDNV